MKDKLDFLSELGNIGASYATTALSKMLHDAKLKLTVPQSRLLSFNEAANYIPDPKLLLSVCICGWWKDSKPISLLSCH